MSDRINAKKGSILSNIPVMYYKYFTILLKYDIEQEDAEKIIEIIYNLDLGRYEINQARKKLEKLGYSSNDANKILDTFSYVSAA